MFQGMQRKNVEHSSRPQLFLYYVLSSIQIHACAQATTSGSQSQKWKVDKIKGLLVRAKGSEAKYIIRGLQGKLRIGLAQTTVLASLSHAVVLTHPHGVMPLTEERLQEIRGLDGKEGRCIKYATVFLFL